MAAVLDDMVKRQKHKSRIMGFGRMHQLAAQVVHRGVPAQIIAVSEVRVIEKRVLPGSGCLIVRKKRAFMQSSEKERVSLSDLRREEFFQIQKSLFSPLQTPAGNTRHTTLRRRFCFVEQSCAPHGISFESENVVFLVSRCPAHGICTYIKADKIRRIYPV